MLGSMLTSAMLSSNLMVKTMSTVLYRNADKILLAAGIGMICGGTISAVATTTKISDIKEDHKRCLEIAKAQPEDIRKKEVFKVYRDTAIDTLKAYGPCVLLTGLGIGCIMGSHYILSSRYAALSVAYTALDKSFSNYRDRVKAAIGEKKEYDLYTDKFTAEVTEVDENGNSHTTKVSGRNGSQNPYSFIFDESNPNWQKDAELNEIFLEQRQDWLNRRLDKAGVVTLAEVLYELNIYENKKDIPSYAFDMAWVKDNPNGDGYIDFGHRASMDFMSHREPSVWLNFNCDGLLRKIRKEKDPYAATVAGSGQPRLAIA